MPSDPVLGLPPGPAPHAPSEDTVERLLADGARVMWCAAHPDDEFMGGALLARASLHYGNPVAFVVLTHGEGGSTRYLPAGESDLGAVRAREMAAVAEAYGAELRMERYWNAPLPMSSFPSPDAIWSRWREQGDPVQDIAEEIRRFRPDLVLTFEPTYGVTGHPEHLLASRATTAAVARAADARAEVAGLEPHAVRATRYVLKRHWGFRLLFHRLDPGPVTETWDGDLPCANAPDEGTTCMDFCVAQTRHHGTQRLDMGMFRAGRRLFTRHHLRHVAP